MISDAAKTLSKEGRKIIIVRNMAHGLVMLYQCYAPWMITHDLLFRKTAILAIDGPGIVSEGDRSPRGLVCHAQCVPRQPMICCAEQNSDEGSAVAIDSGEGATMKEPHVLGGVGYGLALVIAGLWVSACAQPQPKNPDVEYVPTPHNVVGEMLQLLAVKPTDVVYDLGCGDGRVVITAAKRYKARGVGIDIDPQRIKESRANARRAGVVNRVKFLQQDLFETDIREASVVALYLLPDLNRKLRPKLLSDLRPGTRVASHDFDMGDWHPDRVIYVRGSEYEHTVFYWVIPANIDGAWQMSVPSPTGERRYLLRIQQQYQEVRGTVSAEGEAILISNATLTGDHLRFTVTTGIQGEEVRMSFDGRVSANAMRGSMEVQGGTMAGQFDWSAQRDGRNSSDMRQH
jgi:SAM-dependent methyltransferase